VQTEKQRLKTRLPVVKLVMLAIKTAMQRGKLNIQRVNAESSQQKITSVLNGSFCGNTF
jgi:hypothetical protein